MADETASGVNGPLAVRYCAMPKGGRAGGKGDGKGDGGKEDGSGHTGRHRAELVIPAAELTWRFSRSAGPGGQGVNTTDSRAELSFDLAATTALPRWLKARAFEHLAGRLVNGVLTITSSEQRSQLQNREAARERLAQVLADALAPPPPPRRQKKVPAGVTRRRLEEKTRRGQTKQLRRRVEDY